MATGVSLAETEISATLMTMERSNQEDELKPNVVIWR